jgi:small subunit ribosomal protein S16
MATKIRLQRHGRKRYPFYHIVVADARAPRDGRIVEKIGTYNPNVEPQAIDLDFDSAVKWVLNGAQPTDTARKVLSIEGVMYKKHLQVGVNKGAVSQEDADKKFDAWKAEKDKEDETRLAGDAKAKADAITDAQAKREGIRAEAEKVAKEAEEAALKAAVEAAATAKEAEEAANTEAEAEAESEEESSEETAG